MLTRWMGRILGGRDQPHTARRRSSLLHAPATTCTLRHTHNTHTHPPLSGRTGWPIRAPSASLHPRPPAAPRGPPGTVYMSVGGVFRVRSVASCQEREKRMGVVGRLRLALLTTPPAPPTHTYTHSVNLSHGSSPPFPIAPRTSTASDACARGAKCSPGPNPPAAPSPPAPPAPPPAPPTRALPRSCLAAAPYLPHRRCPEGWQG